MGQGALNPRLAKALLVPHRRRPKGPIQARAQQSPDRPLAAASFRRPRTILQTSALHEGAAEAEEHAPQLWKGIGSLNDREGLPTKVRRFDKDSSF